MKSGVGTLGFPRLKSKTFSAPTSAVRFCPYSKIVRIVDFFVPSSYIFSETIEGSFPNKASPVAAGEGSRGGGSESTYAFRRNTS